MAETKLKGMRDLSEDEINLMNEIADLGNKFGDLIDRVECFDPEQPDMRWFNIGKTHIQEGIMCLKRAIGKPENF
jgi:hypothetical protein